MGKCMPTLKKIFRYFVASRGNVAKVFLIQLCDDHLGGGFNHFFESSPRNLAER